MQLLVEELSFRHRTSSAGRSTVIYHGDLLAKGKRASSATRAYTKQWTEFVSLKFMVTQL